MERYFKRKFLYSKTNAYVKLGHVEINLIDLSVDSGLRKKLVYHLNERDSVRRYYLLKEPYQPCDHEFT